jgi:chitin synthase
VEGETKGEGHGDGGGKKNVQAVPMRRWEDWERSRLRKLKREERRRREFERAHPSGYFPGDLLSVRTDTRSQYDGSDTLSIGSSDDDHWGHQIGGYNEHNASYPPPPAGLYIPSQALQNAKTVDASELEAMLESGFDDRPTPPTSTYAPRYQLSDTGSSMQLAGIGGHGYAPLTRATSPGAGHVPPSINNVLSPTSPTLHMSGESPRLTARHGSGDRYGPLGPLDPSTRL